MPSAIAYIRGSQKYSRINGVIKFYEVNNGTIINLEINGLPNYNKNNFFGFHIHNIGKCEEFINTEPFSSAGTHLNLENDKHPNHTGDLPVLYSNNGYSYMSFFTSRFRPSDVIGKSIIIHERMDDLKTDPSGNSGNRIACGVIKPYIL